MSAILEPKSAAWLDQVQEDIIDPERRIIDPHHHLWSKPLMFGRYELADLWADTGSGHNIEKTVFIDCPCELSKRWTGSLEAYWRNRIRGRGRGCQSREP